MKTLLTFLLIGLFGINSVSSAKGVSKTATDKNGYTYQYVENDPIQARIYTLKNGLKVYLSQNDETPKISTQIAVKAGSTYDPAQTTGLAHYLEHMLFKGTSKIGALDWEKEKVLLKQISDLYEKHRNETDPEKKKAIYKEIDKVSNEAAKLVAANELDKMVTSLGASGTNAFTSTERTVYINTIPSNELEKWLQLEKERFSELVLRLFHTEIEAVYEEFNMSQDNDFRTEYYAALGELFKKHPYGTQTTIGTAEHLKNPSLVNIHNYFEKYYVPNNMAVILAGDLDYDMTIKLIDKYMGGMKTKAVAPNILPKEDPITKHRVKTVFGPDREYASMSFRFDGIKSDQRKYVEMIDMILSNRQAGIIDIDLVLDQKVLGASCSPNFENDYGFHRFTVYPKQGQSLEEGIELLKGTIEKVKKGDFEDWLMEAVIKDLKLNKIRGYESNGARVNEMQNLFIHNLNWEEEIAHIDELDKLTKKELVDFANKYYKENYVVIYKKQGPNPDVVKVEKPEITPVSLNREDESAFFKKFKETSSPRLTPQFIDYKSLIKSTNISDNVKLDYIKNTNNELFNMSYILDMGGHHDKELSIAAGYIEYLGTNKLAPKDFKKELYKNGINFGVNTSDERTYVTISGLDESFEKSLEIFEDLMANAVANKEAYEDYINNILKNREESKNNKGAILYGGLLNMATEGKTNSFNDVISEEKLRSMTAEQMVEKIKSIFDYKHYAFYYGPRSIENVAKAAAKYHKIKANLKDYPAKKEYQEVATGNKVMFAHYPMVQTNLFLVAKDTKFDKNDLDKASIFAEYFGSGLSSIVFQEIRETKALAYSAYSQYATASKKDKSNYVYAFIGTQANKLKDAIAAMQELLNKMPHAVNQFNGAREAALKKIESQRITKSSIYWNYKSNLERGIDYDIRKELYNNIKNMKIEDLDKFFQKHISKDNFTFCLMGDRENINFDELKKFGEVVEFNLEDLFGY
jgi:predicted Zn-dependent peptidase